MDFKYCKLEIFIPETHITQLQKALQSVDAGHIGKYDSCMSCSQLISYWRPLDGTDPYIGKAGEISCEREVKVEVTVYTEKVEETIRAIKEVHPYEEPVINALPIYKTSFLQMEGSDANTIYGDNYNFTLSGNTIDTIISLEKYKFREIQMKIAK